MHRTTRDITNAEFANRARSRWWEIQMLKFAIIFQYKFDKKKKKKKKIRSLSRKNRTEYLQSLVFYSERNFQNAKTKNKNPKAKIQITKTTIWYSARGPEAEGRGFLPREISLSRDHLRPSVANLTRVCMTAFVSRCVYYFTR